MVQHWYLEIEAIASFPGLNPAVLLPVDSQSLFLKSALYWAIIIPKLLCHCKNPFCSVGTWE